MSGMSREAAARIRAAQQRAALDRSKEALTERLRPSAIAARAWDSAKDKGAAGVEQALDYAKARPWTVAGVAAATGAVLAREPILDGIGRARDWWRDEEQPVARRVLPMASLLDREEKSMTDPGFSTDAPLGTTPGMTEKAADALHSARDKAADSFASAKDKAADAYHQARDKAADAYSSARIKAIHAYDAARDRTADVRAKAADSIDDNPIIALGAGLALGALVSALIPSLGSRRD